MITAHATTGYGSLVPYHESGFPITQDLFKANRGRGRGGEEQTHSTSVTSVQQGFCGRQKRLEETVMPQSTTGWG